MSHPIHMVSNMTAEPFAGASPVVAVDGSTVHIDGLTINDRAVAEYVSSVAAADRPERIVRALVVGVRGLSGMALGASLSEVDDRVQQALAGVADEAERRVDEMLAGSRSILTDTLDPDVRSSMAARMIAEMHGLHSDLLVRLDPDRGDSHTGRLVERLTSLLGPDGQLERRFIAALDPAIDDSSFGRHQARLEQQLTELRDLIIGTRSKKEEAKKGTAKGFDFEDAVEDVVRREAGRIGGCVVVRTGQTPGALGPQALVGDLLVEAPRCRIVIEAKDAARIDLGGSGGILKELDDAAANRDAGYAICVSRNDAFPGEVGAFGVYDNRVLVVDDGDGILLSAALRWTLAAADRERTTPAEAVDLQSLTGRLGRVRELANRLSRLKRTLTSVRAGIDAVRSDVDTLRAQLLEEVDELARELRVGTPSPNGQRPENDSAVRIS